MTASTGSAAAAAALSAAHAGRGGNQDQWPTPQVGNAGESEDSTSDSSTGTLANGPALEAGRRLVESLIIAVITSTGVYLVGSVYTDAYYGRMSIDSNALDLPPSFIALQAVHALQSLLFYPMAVLLLYLPVRFIAPRLPRVRLWVGQQVDRFGRLAILVINGLVVLPLVAAAVSAGSDRAVIQTTSALSEVVSLMQAAGIALLVYVVWLSLERRAFLLAELQRHQIVPVMLVFVILLFGALVNTAERARTNAERLMTGASDTSLAATLIMAKGVPPLPSAEVILVAMRNGHHFVVERQPNPPSLTPRSYAVPFRSVDAVELERDNPAPIADQGIVITVDWFSTDPVP